MSNDDMQSNISVVDFAGFLHENPGARRVWEAREMRTLKYRRILNSDQEDFSFWRKAILAHLKQLDQENSMSKTQWLFLNRSNYAKATMDT